MQLRFSRSLSAGKVADSKTRVTDSERALMPQAAPIVINDGATTPVAITFSPIGKDEKGILWFEQTTPTPVNSLAAKRISYRQTRGQPGANKLNQGGKAIYVLWVPTTETMAVSSSGVIPPPQLAYKQAARIEFDLPERGATQERKDLRVLASNLLVHASTVSSVDLLQPMYT